MKKQKIKIFVGLIAIFAVIGSLFLVSNSENGSNNIPNQKILESKIESAQIGDNVSLKKSLEIENTKNKNLMKIIHGTPKAVNKIEPTQNKNKISDIQKEEVNNTSMSLPKKIMLPLNEVKLSKRKYSTLCKDDLKTLAFINKKRKNEGLEELPILPTGLNSDECLQLLNAQQAEKGLPVLNTMPTGAIFNKNKNKNK